jgi:hypothetical protein
VTSSDGKVQVRWLPGCSPGGVDLTMVGLAGTIERAVSWPEAATAGVVIDLLCPGSNWAATMRQLPPAQTCIELWRP